MFGKKERDGYGREEISRIYNPVKKQIQKVFKVSEGHWDMQKMGGVLKLGKKKIKSFRWKLEDDLTLRVLTNIWDHWHVDAVLQFQPLAPGSRSELPVAL